METASVLLHSRTIPLGFNLKGNQIVFAAIALAFYGLYGFRKHSVGEANIIEQLSIVTSVFTWLTLCKKTTVWRLLCSSTTPHDTKWDVNPPKWYRLLFYVGVMVGHWLAAFEAPELHGIPGGWSNVGVWILTVATLLMQYNSTLYLAKYSEKKAKLEEVLMVETFGDSEYASKVRRHFRLQTLTTILVIVGRKDFVMYPSYMHISVAICPDGGGHHLGSLKYFKNPNLSGDWL
ncbi:hypothetical protein CRYUN_Cryun25bG0103200 [Craigia yunnanensis]